MIKRPVLSRSARGCLALCAAGLVLATACRSGNESEERSQPPAEAAAHEPVPAATAAPDTASATQEIAQTFADYAEATRARDGVRAAQLVTRGTLEHYEALRALAVRAARQHDDPTVRNAVRARSLGDRLLMMQMLAVLGPDHLAHMRGREILSFGVDEGLLGAQTFADSGLGPPTLLNDVVATAPVLDEEGVETGASWRFVREDQRWRLDLTAPMHYASAQMANDARARGLAHDAYLARVAESLPDVAPRDPWRRVTSPGGFSVELPGAPEVLEETRPGLGEVHFLVARSVTGATCFAGFSELPGAPPADDEARDAVLRAAAQGVAQSLDGRIIEARALTLESGQRGILVEVELASGQRAATQLVLDDSRLVELIAVGPREVPMTVWQRCLGTLQLE